MNDDETKMRTAKGPIIVYVARVCALNAQSDALDAWAEYQRQGSSETRQNWIEAECRQVLAAQEYENVCRSFDTTRAE